MVLNSTYICDDSSLELVIRNNINGDFSIIDNLTDIKPGAFINIKWNNKRLMLPYSLRKDYLSFTDRKWDWRYQLNQNKYPNTENPSLYELLPSGKIKQHICQLEENNSDISLQKNT